MGGGGGGTSLTWRMAGGPSLYIDTADEWGENQLQIIIVVDVEGSF